MNKEEFEKIVARSIKSIPKRFLDRLVNIAIVVENNPTEHQRKELKIRKGWTLYGLYEGVPMGKRGSGYSGVLPDKITIFKDPIEHAARSEEEIEGIVRNTIWHEIAHYFGMDEIRVKNAEDKRNNKK